MATYRLVLLSGLALVSSACSTPRSGPETDREPSAWGDCRSRPLDPSVAGRYLLGNSGFADYLSDNEYSWVRRLRVLESATRKLYLQTYIFESDTYGKAMLGGLLKKQLEGVQVHLMIDALGSQTLPKTALGQDYLQELVLAGARVHVYAPVLATLRPRIFGSNHDKIMIADDCHTIIGGRNIADRYFQSYSEEPTAYADAELHVESAPLALEAVASYDDEARLGRNYSVRRDIVNLRSRRQELLAAYEEALKKAKSSRHWPRPWRPSISGIVRIFDNHSRHHGPERLRLASEATIEALKIARHEIVILNPYIVLTPEMRDALAAASLRGVRILLLTNSPTSSDSMLTQAVFSREWPELLREVPSMRIFVGLGPEKLHSKVMVVDGRISLVGSFNLDNLSDKLNSESFVMAESEKLADRIGGEIKDYIRANTVEYRIENGRPFGPELLDAKKVRKVRRLHGIGQVLRSRI